MFLLLTFYFMPLFSLLFFLSFIENDREKKVENPFFLAGNNFIELSGYLAKRYETGKDVSNIFMFKYTNVRIFCSFYS